MLRARGHQQAAQLLNDIPFELHEGTNGFGDEFSVLYWSAPFDRYIEAAEWKDNPAYRSAFEQIAKTVTEVASTYIRFVAVELNTDEGPAAVESPNLQITNDVVERALQDAERLLSTSGATSGIDRVHTALHGYLRAACDKSSIAHGPDPSITEFFKLLRQHHPAFSHLGAQAVETQRVVMAFATVVDALNPVRNRGSMAHARILRTSRQLSYSLVLNKLRGGSRRLLTSTSRETAQNTNQQPTP